MTKKWVFDSVILVASVAIAMSVMAAPATMMYQGRLTDASGHSLTSISSIRFAIFDAKLGGSILWEETHTNVSLDEQGIFTVELGIIKAIPDTTFSNREAYLELTVNGQVLSPRQPFGATPVAYTISSHGADSGQVLKWNGNAWAPDDAASGNAVTLSDDQTITGNKIFSGSNRFDGDVHFSDSTMRVTPTGVVIGRNAWYGDTTVLLSIQRSVNTSKSRTGIMSLLKNEGDGYLVGNLTSVESTTPGSTGGGWANAIIAIARSDGDARIGVDANASCQTDNYTSGTSYGLRGYAQGGSEAYGVYGSAHGAVTGYGVYGWASTNTTINWAGYFDGNIRITGMQTGGNNGILMDHPLDPENKYLYHNSVNSPDMLNVYSGNIVLDNNGEGTVSLPAYVEALNKDFRYQLTAIGTAAPGLYVAEKIVDGRFKISGGQARMEVSWQVTGLRHDPYAEANGPIVEADKPETERGRYLHPEAYGLGKESGLHYEMHERSKSRQEMESQVHRLREASPNKYNNRETGGNSHQAGLQ